MKGLVIVTHSTLGAAFLKTAEMILGTVKNAKAVCLEKEDSVDAINRKIAEAIKATGHDGDGVVVMTDMFGGTPSNVSLAFLEPGKVEVVTGVNLPMVLSFYNSKNDMPLDGLVKSLQKAGGEGIVLPSALLAE